MLNLSQVVRWCSKFFWPKHSFKTTSSGSRDRSLPVVLSSNGTLHTSLLPDPIEVEVIKAVDGDGVIIQDKDGNTIATFTDGNDVDAASGGFIARSATTPWFRAVVTDDSDSGVFQARDSNDNNMFQVVVRGLDGAGGGYVEFFDGDYYAFDGDVRTAVVRALTAAGLRLEDDAGNLGVFVEDGGQVGIGTASPFTTGDIMLTVVGSIATATGGRVYLENGTGTRAAQIINTAASGDSNIEFRTGDGASPTTKMTLKKTGQVFFDGAVQDMLSLFDDRLGATNMLGFGVESGAMYAKSGNTHRWYVNANADGGTSSVMDLDANYLTPFVGLGEAWNAPTFNTGWSNSTGTEGAGYRKFGDMVMLKGNVDGGSGDIFTLPAGYHPPSDIFFLCHAIDGSSALSSASVCVRSNGDVEHVAGDVSTVGLSGIIFNT